MCFSAQISFISAGVLFLTGVVCIKKAQKAKHHVLLAITPFIFAIQQFLEGFVWVTFNREEMALTNFFSSAYLFFAFFFWIVWFPIVAYILESVQWKKKLFRYLVFVGFVFGLYLWLPVLFGHGPRNLIDTTICGKSLCYNIASGGYLPMVAREFVYVLLGLLYLLCSDPLFRKFWVAVMLSAAITLLIHAFAWTSVWCFLSAIASLYIIYLITAKPKKIPQLQ